MLTSSKNSVNFPKKLEIISPQQILVFLYKNQQLLKKAKRTTLDFILNNIKQTSLENLSGTLAEELVKIIHADPILHPIVKQQFSEKCIFVSGKKGGCNHPGVYGGVYYHIGSQKHILFKQDTHGEKHNVHKDISEFLSAGLSNAMFPVTDNGEDLKVPIAPTIILVEHPLGPEYAPYIGSVFYDQYDDLYKDIYKTNYQLELAKNLWATVKDVPITRNVLHDNKKLNELAVILKRSMEQAHAHSKYNATSKKFKKLLTALDTLLVSNNKNPADKITLFKKSIEDYIKLQSKKIPKDRQRAIGTKQYVGMKEGKLFRNALLNKDENHPQYVGTEKGLIVSLLCADFDSHFGNWGAVKISDCKKQMVRIDLGAAFHWKHFFKVNDKEKLQPEKDVHMHSHALSKHLFGLEPTNHVREFPRSIKISEPFAFAIDKGIKQLRTQDKTGTKSCLHTTCDRLLDEVAAAYALDDIKQFAKHIGMDHSEKIDSRESLQNRKAFYMHQLKDYFREMMESRLAALEKLSLEIKIAFCFEKDDKVGFKLIPNKQAALHQLIANYPDYFSHANFHFRKKEQKGNIFTRQRYHEKLTELVLTEVDAVRKQYSHKDPIKSDLYSLQVRFSLLLKSATKHDQMAIKTLMSKIDEVMMSPTVTSDALQRLLNSAKPAYDRLTQRPTLFKPRLRRVLVEFDHVQRDLLKLISKLNQLAPTLPPRRNRR